MGYGGWQGAKGLLKSVPSKDNRYASGYAELNIGLRYKLGLNIFKDTNI